MFLLRCKLNKVYFKIDFLNLKEATMHAVLYKCFTNIQDTSA